RRRRADRGATPARGPRRRRWWREGSWGLRLHQVVGPGAGFGGLVAGIEQRTAPQGEAAAADAAGQAPADALERRDAQVELGAPAAREPLPVALGRRPVLGQRV